MSLYAWLQVPQLKWTVALPGEKPFHIHYSLAQHSKCGCRNSFHLKNPQIRRTNGMHGSQRHSPGCCSPTHGCPKFLTSVTMTQAKKNTLWKQMFRKFCFFPLHVRNASFKKNRNGDTCRGKEQVMHEQALQQPCLLCSSRGMSS